MADGKGQQTWFPFDMVAEILLRLPVKSLKRFECVRMQAMVWFNLRFLFCYGARQSCQERHQALEASYFDAASRIHRLRALLKHEVMDMLLQADDLNLVYDLVYIVGSCNGLICLHGVRRVIRPNHQDFILVWNPSTGDTCELPEHPSFIDDHESHCGHLLPMLYGFGYDSSTEDYKVILGNMIDRVAMILSAAPKFCSLH